VVVINREKIPWGPLFYLRPPNKTIFLYHGETVIGSGNVLDPHVIRDSRIEIDARCLLPL